MVVGGCQIVLNLDDFSKNELDELKLIVGECAPNLGATIADRFVKPAGRLRSKQFGKGGYLLCRL
jgi:hypothetical protein